MLNFNNRSRPNDLGNLCFKTINLNFQNKFHSKVHSLYNTKNDSCTMLEVILKITRSLSLSIRQLLIDYIKV